MTTAQALTLDPEHIYRLDGRIIPGVTGVLERHGISDFSMVPEGVLSASQWRGSAVHVASRYDDENALDSSSVLPEHQGFLNSWRELKAVMGPKMVFSAIEKPLHHPQLLYAGTPDRVGELDGHPALWDLKSGDPQRAAAIQTAAYAHLLPFAYRIRRFVVRLKANGKLPTVTEYTQRDLAADFEVFKAALVLETWMNS